MSSFKTILQSWREAIDRVFGLPNYERYLVHQHACHPEQTPLTRGEFYARAEQHRYGRDGSKKCC